MTIEKFVHENVKRDGTFEDRLGAVETDGGVRMSTGEGCGLPECSCSGGCWISITMPLRDGKVEGIIARFDSEAEIERFLKFHEAYQ